MDDGWWERAGRDSYAPGRTLGVSEGAALIGTATSFPTRTALPGGTSRATAAVTRVGVRADRTRRGVLSALMRTQLLDTLDRGEALASLRASEARIYGRFGYGVATRARGVGVRSRGAGWRAGAPSGGSVRLVAREDAEKVLAGVHDAIALRRPGGIERRPQWWTGNVGQPIAKDEALLVAVHTGPGGDDGFAVAAPGEGGSFAERVLRVEDLHAADVGAAAGLWRFLLGLDLIGRVQAWRRPLDEPLELLLADPRDCSVTDVEDETWLRLVDVPAALAARRWNGTSDVLVGVHDPLLHRNSGVYRIGGDGAERVGEGVAPDLECGVDALAMAYLGDRTPSALAATGWWRVRDHTVLARADELFATDTAPWCGTFF